MTSLMEFIGKGLFAYLLMGLFMWTWTLLTDKKFRDFIRENELVDVMGVSFFMFLMWPLYFDRDDDEV